MTRGSPFAVAALGLLLASASCTTASHVEPYVQPTLAALSVVVTTNPPARADGTVPRNARFVVQLDGYPDPDSVGYGPLTLRSGRANFDIDVGIDFVGQQVIVTPRSLLAPGVQYDLVVSGLSTLDDRAQGADVVGSVHVGADTGDPFAAPPRPTWTADVEPILGHCAPYCHSSVDQFGRTRTPTRLLDITPASSDGTPDDPHDPVLGLIGVTSVGLLGTRAPLMRVAPFDPAHSVLLRKLIGGDPQADSQDPPYPSMRVDGRRMPLFLDDTAGAPLPDEQLRTIQDWIAAGAPID
jgi:hypothetical protein